MFRESLHLRLRPPTERDIARFLRWFNDAAVIENLTPYLPISEIGEREWLRTLCISRAKTDIVLVIETKRPRLFPIGNVGIHKIDHKNANAEISVAIGEKSYWGRGLGPEAMATMIEYGFNELNLHRFYTGAFDFNLRSIAMLKGLGFVQEGVQRHAVFTRGAYHDIFQFGLLRNEWELARSPA